MQCVRTHNNIGQITELHNAGEGFVEKPSRLSAGNKEGYSYSQRSIRGHFMIDHPVYIHKLVSHVLSCPFFHKYKRKVKFR